MRIRHSVLALALLFVLSAISGCKRQVDIELNPNHLPTIYVYEGQVLKVRPSKSDLTFTLASQQGLCKESGPMRGTREQPPVCTIAKQSFDDDKPNTYTLTVSGSEPTTYNVNVFPCTGFCPLTKPCTGFCPH